MALNAYLTLRGTRTGRIRGSVTLAGRMETIEVNAVDHQVNAELDRDGLPTGNFTHQALVLTIDQDQSWPLLWQMLADNEAFTEFTLRFYRRLPTGVEEQYYTIALVNGHIASIKHVKQDVTISELQRYETRMRIAFTYDRIDWLWVAGGRTASSDWITPV